MDSKFSAEELFDILVNDAQHPFSGWDFSELFPGSFSISVHTEPISKKDSFIYGEKVVRNPNFI